MMSLSVVPTGKPEPVSKPYWLVELADSTMPLDTVTMASSGTTPSQPAAMACEYNTQLVASALIVGRQTKLYPRKNGTSIMIAASLITRLQTHAMRRCRSCE